MDESGFKINFKNQKYLNRDQKMIEEPFIEINRNYSKLEIVFLRFSTSSERNE